MALLSSAAPGQYDTPAPQGPDVSGPVSWGDYGEAAAAGLYDQISNLGAGTEALADKGGMENVSAIADYIRHTFRIGAENAEAGMSDSARNRMKAAVTSPEFWEHPISAAALQATNMAPGMAMAVAPALLTEGGSLLATGAVAGVGATQGAAASAADAYNFLDDKDDNQLKKDVPYYYGLRAMGMDEDQAKKDTAQKAMGLSPLINGLVNGAAMLMGPAGRLAGLLPEEAGAGIIKRALVGGAEGALGMGAAGATAEATHEQGAVDLGMSKGLDPAQIMAAGVQSGAQMGLMGALTGIVTPHGKSEGTKTTENVGDKEPDQSQKAALDAANPNKPAVASEPPPVASTSPTTEGGPLPSSTAKTPPATGGEAGAAGAGTESATTAEQTAPATATAGEPAPVDKSAQEGAAALAKSDDTNTVPETKATLNEQYQQLLDGNRRAMLFPKEPGKKGRVIPPDEMPIPDGMKKVELRDGTWYYNPEHVSYGDLKKAVAESRQNEILGLGDFSKKDLAPKVAAGETPVGVQEVTPQGNEVRTAAATLEGTAADTAAKMQQDKTPGNAIVAKDPRQVVAERQAGAAGEQAVAVAKDRQARQAALREKAAAEAAAAEKPAGLVKELPARAGEGPKRVLAQVTKIDPRKAALLTDDELRNRIASYTGPEMGQERIDQWNADRDEETYREWKQSHGMTRDEYAQMKKDSLKNFGKMLGVGDVEFEPETPELPAADRVTEAGNKAAAEATASYDKVKAQTEARGLKMAYSKEEYAERARTKAVAAEIKAVAKDANKKGTGAGRASKERGKGAKYEQKDRDARALLNRKADSVVEKHAPTPEERDALARPEGKQAVIDRARAMVETADKEGVQIGALRDTEDKSMQTNNSVAIIKEARDLLKAKEPSAAAVTKFLSREFALRHGGEEGRAEVLAERRAEAARNKQVEEGKVAAEPEGEVKAETTPEERADVEEAEGVHAPEAEETHEGEVEPETSYEAEGQERAPVTLTGNDFTFGEQKEGRFKQTTAGSVLKEKAPKVTGKIKLGFKGVKRLGGGDVPEPHELENITPLQSGTVASFLKDMPVIQGKRGAIHSILGPHVEGVLRKIVGDTRVHVISEEDMARTAPPDEDGRPTRGITSRDDTGRPVIYIAEGETGNLATLRATLAHEAIHAAVWRALDENPRLRSVVALMARQMAKDVGEVYGPKAKVYGFKDEHEFLSEVLSNPHFMEQAAYSTVSEDVKTALGLTKSRMATVRDAVVQIIRKILGIDKRPETVSTVEAALEAFNQLSGLEPEVLPDARQFGRGQPKAEPRAFGRAGIQGKRMAAGDFSSAGHDPDINDMFQPKLEASLGRNVQATKDYVSSITRPGKWLSDTVNAGSWLGQTARKAGLALMTNAQYGRMVEKILPHGRQVFDLIERSGVRANKLKEEGIDLAAAMYRAQKENPGLFQKFSELLHRQTMVGVDASQELGEGRNAHIKPKDDASKESMSSWEARDAHPELRQAYADIVKQDPRFADLQKHVFDYYDKTQSAMQKGLVEHILGEYEFKGTDAEKRQVVSDLLAGTNTKAFREQLAKHVGDGASDLLAGSTALRVRKGPYAPLIRRGDNAIVGRYKVTVPGNATKVGENTYEFKTAKEARDFAKSTGLHYQPDIKYYDPNTGKPVARKEEAISTTGSPQARYQIKLTDQHLEFHENLNDAKARLKELQDSGLFHHVTLEEKRNLLTEKNEFGGRGVEALLRSLAQQDKFKNASEAQKKVLQDTIREAGLRAMADNRVQSRRLPRRNIMGASDDAARNLYEYNHSQANYRARLEFQPQIDAALKAMHEYVKGERYAKDTDPDENYKRTQAANEIEKRAQAPDPNDYTGAYSNAARRIMAWSYIDRMVRPSHLILHQTHLPMITIPYLSGRHGLLSSYAAATKAIRELSGFYKAGGADAWAHTVGSSLQKGTDYAELGKKLVKGTADEDRLGQMFDELSATGHIHPSAGIEVSKYQPNRQLPGALGALDQGLNKVDSIFRQLTNATEAMNRFAGATAAYRLEFNKLTREGKGEAAAHKAAVEYAKQTIEETQGLFSSTNAAPLFKNAALRPFLQFKQFPQMMYHLLGKLAIQGLRGENKMAKVQALGSLAAILGMHSMMAGVLQGLPLEPFKVLGMISKGVGLTDGDWNDVENYERAGIKSTFGDDLGKVLINGLGSTYMGVDVHHRLGLNSFMTYGMPDQIDEKSVTDFIGNALGGAPYGLASDTLKGIHKMLTGDIEGGALQAAPFQTLRDIHNAINPAANKYGYVPTGADAAKSLLGFTPAAKAQAAEAKEAVYNAVQDYNAKRTALTQEWTGAAPEDRDAAWQKISDWNATQPASAQITKGDLFKALHAANRNNVSYNRLIGGIKTTPHNKEIAQGVYDLYK